MPELPEVEHLRRSLEPALVGTRIESVRVRRRSVVSRGETGLERALLAGATICSTARRGKQMALVAGDGRVLVVQLGMTGSVTIESGAHPRGAEARHRHVVWALESACRMVFRDPRRFGGLTAYPDEHALALAWSALGPDALHSKPAVLARHLAQVLAGRLRPVKAALLDQTVVAGIGNIYADESLFAARIHPLRPAATIRASEWDRLAQAIGKILARAADEGGSTLRDYRDAFGRPGQAVQNHQVYGRSGEPCLNCSTAIGSIRLQGRTTAFCPCCQDLST
jgi:formamidopyrimidine-DNA glycosylase